jgi:Fe-S cluster biogenesis protein NfuA/nitrite reductase/ring-hydroxylating ferredoxin subunit
MGATDRVEVNGRGGTEREELAAPQRLIERVQELQLRLDEAGDPIPRETAEELVAALIQMYGLGLERIMGSLEGLGDASGQLASALVQDPLVATLLLIHDLHPIPLRQRVQDALDSVSPYMESHGGSVEFLSLEDGVARIHLRGSCSDCSASSVTLELAIKQALEETAPDLAGLEVEGVAPQMSGLALPMAGDGIGNSGAELPVVMAGHSARSDGPRAPSWFDVSMDDLTPGAIRCIEVAGQALVIAEVDGTLLAYHDRCASCEGTLHDGELTGGALACAHCGRSFFLPRAGRSLDDDHLQLEPVPLLREQGAVRVALAA